MNEELEKRKRRMAARLEAIVKKEFGVKFWRLTAEDEVRSLRLEQWEEKYRVSLEWILKTIVPIWKQKFSRYTGVGFGVKIPTLVGTKSEEILRAKILEQWPDGENIRQWQATEQQRQWSRYRQGIRQTENWDQPLIAARDYQHRMEREREVRKAFAKKACTRPYRGNPWTT